MVGVILLLVCSLVLQLSSAYEGLGCNFEEPCAWKWKQIIHGFEVVTGQDNASPEKRLLGTTGPHTDVHNTSSGHFLIMHGNVEPQFIKSPQYTSTKEQCYLSVAVHMAGMQHGSFRVVVHTVQNTTWVVDEKKGNDRKRWEIYNFNLGRIRPAFHIMLEMVPSNQMPSHLALDNIKLVDCFSGADNVKMEGVQEVKDCKNSTAPECSSGVDNIYGHYLIVPTLLILLGTKAILLKGH